MLLIIVLLIFLSSLYFVMVLGFWIGLQRMKELPEPINKAPLPISVVCAIRNEEENINHLLKSLSGLDYPSELYEILLVNDNSTDASWEIAQEWMSKLNNLVLLELSPEKTGKKYAISLGIMQAQNNIIVQTDADCVHPTNWLSDISDSYKVHKWCLLIGPVMLSPAKSIFQKMQSLEHASLTASSLGSCMLGFPVLASSANLAFNRESVKYSAQMLNLSQPSGDDMFLLHSIKQKKCAKISCSFTNNSMVYTMPATTLQDFFIQRARWASKATAYRDWQTVLVSLIVFLFNLLIVGLIVSTFFSNEFSIWLGVAYLIKIIVDFPLLYSFLRRFNKTSLLKTYIPLQLFYPFYIIIAFAISLFTPVIWKGRKR